MRVWLMGLLGLCSFSVTGAIPNMIDMRKQEEGKVEQNRFAILAHGPNYMLPFCYTAAPNSAPYPELKEYGESLDHIELKFQLSVKVNLLDNLLSKDDTLFVAYTQKSHWQAYNQSLSSPFRETNYEPELIYAINPGWELMGMKQRLLYMGLVHQSNGQAGEGSRSWNRLYMMLGMERGNLGVAIKPWYRIPESAEEDDNPDIYRYLGYGELYAIYRHQDHQFGLMLRNNLQSDNKGAVQLDWRFPIGKQIGGYLQLFSGYGESLIDYNHYQNTIGLGVSLTSWI